MADAEADNLTEAALYEFTSQHVKQCKDEHHPSFSMVTMISILLSHVNLVVSLAAIGLSLLVIALRRRDRIPSSVKGEFHVFMS